MRRSLPKWQQFACSLALWICVVYIVIALKFLVSSITAGRWGFSGAIAIFLFTYLHTMVVLANKRPRLNPRYPTRLIAIVGHGISIGLLLAFLFFRHNSFDLELFSIALSYGQMFFWSLVMVGLLILHHPRKLAENWVCAQCGYDLRGADSLQCPECGRTRVD